MTDHPIDAAIRDQETLLTRLRGKQAEIEKEVQRVLGQIDGLRKAKELIGATPPSGLQTASGVGSMRTNTRPSTSSSTERRRKLSPTWVAVLQFMAASQDRSASLDTTMAMSQRKGLGIERNVLRSQMSIYGKKGIVEPVDLGSFRITVAGMELIADYGPNPFLDPSWEGIMDYSNAPLLSHTGPQAASEEDDDDAEVRDSL